MCLALGLVVSSVDSFLGGAVSFSLTGYSAAAAAGPPRGGATRPGSWRCHVLTPWLSSFLQMLNEHL